MTPSPVSNGHIQLPGYHQKCSPSINTVIKKDQITIHFLQQLREFNLNKNLLVIIDWSVLCPTITDGFGSDKKKYLDSYNMQGLPPDHLSIHDLYSSKAKKQASGLSRDPSLPRFNFFSFPDDATVRCNQRPQD